MMADENSPGGEFSNVATQALASETAENGWVIFESDYTRAKKSHYYGIIQLQVFLHKREEMQFPKMDDATG